MKLPGLTRQRFPIFATALICLALYCAAGLSYDGFFSARVLANFIGDNAEAPPEFTSLSSNNRGVKGKEVCAFGDVIDNADDSFDATAVFSESQDTIV